MRYVGPAFLVWTGYVVAVLVAVGVCTILWVMQVALIDMTQGRAASFRDADMLATIYALGCMVTFPAALPGFLTVLAIALKSRWRSWRRFAVAGALNAAPSHLLYIAFTGGIGVPVGILIASLPAGFAGGAAYWAVAGWRLHRT